VTKASVRVQFGRTLRASSALALVALAGATAAAAQTAAPAQSTDDSATVSTRNKAGSESTVVIITGSRTSQRSSIDRKKKAKTATDSIVAEDIGSFPDKNVDEAVSRVAGISLDRGDNGEGQGFSIRGQGMENTHVDIDGMSVLNTNAALAGGASNATGGRGADLRELPAEMVKSIDVIKGTTAAMQEGSLGGSVHIETRTGLDFRKPFFQFTGAEQMDSTTKKWTPEWNMIFARKFGGGRFGVIGNVSYTEIETTSDQEQPQTTGTAGPSRAADFDQSPNKTFTWANAPVDPTATAGNFQVFNGGGNATYASLSPIQILQKSGAAKTPADCLATFPALTQAQLNAIGAGNNLLGSVASSNVSASNNQKAAQLEQANELQTCLNQWNDYAPSLIRSIQKYAFERRFAAQLRFDYRVNDDLTLYAIGNIANRMSFNDQTTFSLGSPAYNQTGTAFGATSSTTVASSQPTVAGTSNTLLTPRTVATGYGYGFYPYGTGICASPTVSGTGLSQKTTGCGVESDITNAVVDASHHLTSFTLNDGAAGLDTLWNRTRITTWNAQIGGHYHHDNVKLDFFYGDSGSTNQNANKRVAYSANYGSVNVSLTPSGLWSYTLPGSIDIANLPFAALAPAASRNSGAATNVQSATEPNAPSTAVTQYTAAQAALWSPNFTIQWRPTMADDNEKQLKWDLTYDFQDRIPFFQDIQFGMQARDHVGHAYTGQAIAAVGGSGNATTVGAAIPQSSGAYVAPVVVPGQSFTATYRACQPQGTGAGFQQCNYGWAPGTVVGATNDPVGNLTAGSNGVMTYTEGDLAALMQKALYYNKYPFLGDYQDKGNVLTVFPNINPDMIASAIPGNIFNYDCMKTCKGTDGKMYSIPHYAYQEKTTAMYFMFDFEQKLPWNMVFNGNAGERYIKTDTNASGAMTLQHIAVSSTYDPISNPSAPTTTTSVTTFTSLTGHTVDWTPSYNLNLWVIPDKVVLRYYSGHVISRPSPGALLPSGTCSIDERNQVAFNSSLSEDVSDTCSSRVGNPALKPYKAINHNESVEWYPNKDDQFSLTYFYNNVLIGAPIAANIPASNLFAGSAAVDPVTGKPFSGFEFTYPSWVNGPSGLQRGVEFTSKMAFTFLPWFLKYTGSDFNYSKLGYKNYTTSQDLITGAFNPPVGQRSWTENWSLWYDDGRLNARVSYQGQSAYFDFISSCSNALNNQPTSFPQCSGQTIRTPYNSGGSNWRAMTKFIDAKINYKISKDLEIYFQGRNITRAPVSQEYQPNNPYSNGAPMLESFAYGGARWEAGFTIRR